VASDPPTRLGSWALTDYDETWAEVPRALRVLHDVWVQDGVAYLSHWDAGVWLLDVADPTTPAVISHIGDRTPSELLADTEGRGRSEQVSLPGNAHYVTLNDDGTLLALGREAWATADAPPGEGTATANSTATDGATEASTATETTAEEPTTGTEETTAAGTDSESVGGGPGGIDLFDVSDLTAPERLATVEPPPTVDPTLDGLWTTAHNCELRDGVLYSSWYRGGVKRHDVSDPANPEEVTWWADPPHAEFWTARVGTVGETFVASSRGTAAAPAGLYVFPDASGTTTWGFDEVIGGTETVTPELTPTEVPTETTSSMSTAQTSSVTGPGLGLLSTLAALGVGTLGLYSGGDGDDEGHS